MHLTTYTHIHVRLLERCLTSSIINKNYEYKPLVYFRSDFNRIGWIISPSHWLLGMLS